MILPDDSDKKLLRENLPLFIDKNQKSIMREIKLTRKWIKRDKKDYHSFKMAHYKKYTPLIKQ